MTVGDIGKKLGLTAGLASVTGRVEAVSSRADSHCSRTFSLTSEGSSHSDRQKHQAAVETRRGSTTRRMQIVNTEDASHRDKRANVPASASGRLKRRTKYTREYSLTAAAHIRPEWSATRRTQGIAVKTMVKMLQRSQTHPSWIIPLEYGSSPVAAAMSARALPISAAMQRYIIFAGGKYPIPHNGVRMQTMDALSCINNKEKSMMPKLANGPGIVRAFSSAIRHLPKHRRSAIWKRRDAMYRKTRLQIKPETTPPSSKILSSSTLSFQKVVLDSKHEEWSPSQTVELRALAQMFSWL
mmetsp:Transcript_68029/g.162381  ORF Transcript_68029/g.162381 Transcript_68029/m.162381 type:complete len:298 (-) Transcript_68029:853-1746(-)